MEAASPLRVRVTVEKVPVGGLGAEIHRSGACQAIVGQRKRLHARVMVGPEMYAGEIQPCIEKRH